MKYTDLVLLDIKQIDGEEHVKLTGRTNTNILAKWQKSFEMDKLRKWICHVLVCRAEVIMTFKQTGLILSELLKMWRESGRFFLSYSGNLKGVAGDSHLLKE